MMELKVDYDGDEWDISVLKNKEAVWAAWFDDVLDTCDDYSIVFSYDDRNVFIMWLDGLTVKQYKALMDSLLIEDD